MKRRAEESLAPFEAGKHGPWDLPAASHLLRRAGFQPSTDEIDRCLALIGVPRLDQVTRENLRMASITPPAREREAVSIPAR